MSSPLFEILGQALGGQNAQTIGAQLGLDGSQTAKVISMAIPVLVNSLSQNAATPDGLSALQGALDRDHDGSILDNIGGYLGGGMASAIGGPVLGHILGGDQEQVESGIGRATGIDAAMVSKVMAMLAPLVLGALSRANQQTPPSTNITDILSGATGHMQAQAPGGGGLLSQILDRNHDGSAFDDIAQMGMSVLGSLMRGR